MTNKAERKLIKICGMTCLEDIQAANACQPDLVGFVLFYPKSKRNISIEKARELLARLRSDIKSVAVVVSPTREQVEKITAAGFDYIQIHGTLEELLWEAISLPVIKAFNVSDLEAYETWRQKDQIWGYVFDSRQPGSGQIFDWKLLQQIERDDKRWLLAGGINEENVKQALKEVNPDGIDVSSAVENPDKNGRCGGKDPEKMKKIVRMVHNEE